MLYKKIFKNIILLTQGKVKVQEIPLKIAYYALDHYRLARQMKRSRFSIDEVIFRPIDAKDKPSYIEFVRNYFKDRLPEENADISMPRCNGGSIYYVALYKKSIIGGMGLNKISRGDTKLWHGSGLSVLPEFRGYGIGEKLLRTIISVVKDDSSIISANVQEDNYRAIKLFKKVGFSTADELEKSQLTNIEFPCKKLVLVLNNCKNKKT